MEKATHLVIRRATWYLAAILVSVSFLLTGAVHGSPARAQTSTTVEGEGGPIVQLMQNATVGPYLATLSGMTLYTFSSDPFDTSTCSGACATAWPPFASPGGELAPPTVGFLSLINRQDGTQQVTYNGHALYTFRQDVNPGDVNGQGIQAFGGTWSVATPYLCGSGGPCGGGD